MLNKEFYLKEVAKSLALLSNEVAILNVVIFMILTLSLKTFFQAC